MKISVNGTNFTLRCHDEQFVDCIKLNNGKAPFLEHIGSVNKKMFIMKNSASEEFAEKIKQRTVSSNIKLRKAVIVNNEISASINF